jgi:hypothetical protein
MTMRSIFPLLLALAGLAAGCQDKPEANTTAPAKLEKLPEPPKLEPMPALTAVAPEQPPSVSDLPLGDDKEQPKVPKVETLELGVQEISHAEAEPVDYDRPVEAKDIRVDRFVLARDVSGREPVAESDHFDTDTKQIFAFVQLANPDAPYAFTVHFEPVDGPTSLFGVKLDVPTAARWRTWAWTKIERAPGKYRAVLRTLDGEEIVSREFTIDEASK